MPENIVIALRDTGMIFGWMIFFNFSLWVLTMFLRTLTRKADKTIPLENLNTPGVDETLQKKVAIAAVAAAMAIEDDSKPHEFPLPPTALVSAWQAVMRSNILKRHGRPR